MATQIKEPNDIGEETITDENASNKGEPNE